MRRSAPRRVAEWLVLAFLASAIAYMLTTRLATMPGLHGDEAWFGLRAWKIATGCSASIHGMNGYTGAAFPYLVSLVFRALGPSQLSLRTVGVVCNLMALTALASTCAFVRKSKEGGIVFLLLAGASLIVTCELRVAWEVTALNPLLASLLLATSVVWVGDSRAGGLPRRTLTLGCAALFLVSALGMFSHFIFIVFCIGLLVASIASAARGRTASAVQLAVAQCVSLGNVAVLALAKLWLFREALSPPFAVAGFAVLLVLEALVLARVLSDVELISRVRARLERGPRRLRWLLTGYFALGGSAFAVTHSMAFVQTLANDVLVRRFYSVALPLPLFLLSYAYVAALLLVYGGALVRLARGGAATGGETLLLVLPAACAAALPLFVDANAIRHYVLIALALLVGAWVPLSRLEGLLRKTAMWGLFGYGAVVNAFVVSILRSPQHYDGVTPMHFRLGYSVVTSAHFLSLGDTFARMTSEGVATTVTAEPFFIGGPLEFYAVSMPSKPTPGTVATINYDYARPGGLAYEIGPKGL